MLILQHGARVGAATFVVGFSLAWPQAAGIASADTPDQDSPSVSAGPAKSATSSTGKPTRPSRVSAGRSSANAPAAGATKTPAAATTAGSAHSTAATTVAGRTAAVRPERTTKQARRLPSGRVTEGAVAEAVLSAIGNTGPDPASTGASAGSDLVNTGPGFYDTVVQQKILTDGIVDANGSAPDGQVDWNFGYSWALGNSVSSNQYDFQSTATHELLHTFGFLSVVDSAGNNTGNNWTTFDSFIVASDGTAPIDHMTYSWNTNYNTNLTGGACCSSPGAGGLYFGGTNAKLAYGNQPVPLYTPSPWESGSSMSHLNDATFTGASAQLMNAVTDTGLGIRILSPIEGGILKDLGYNVANPPQTLVIFVIGFAFIRRRKRSDEYFVG